MERNAGSRSATNGGSVAPGWVQAVLGDALQGAKTSRRWLIVPQLVERGCDWEGGGYGFREAEHRAAPRS